MTDARGYRDPFEFAARRQGPLHVVSLSGAASIYVTEDLKDRLLSLIDDATPSMVIDLTALTYISSLGIGALLAAGVRSLAARGAARLVNPTGEVAKILTLTQVGKMLEIHATIGDAVGSLPPTSD